MTTSKTIPSGLTGQSLTEYVLEGGMQTAKEVPEQGDIQLHWKYFDIFDTFSPFKWHGSRRLTKG